MARDIEKEKKIARKKRVTQLALEKKAALKSYRRFERVHDRYYKQVSKVIAGSKPTKELFTHVANERLELTGIVRREIKKYAPVFIEEIEKAIPALEMIVNNPSKFIAEVAEDVQIEKAKKITARAVQHLAQNSQFIREIRDDGVVIPKRVLNVYTEDDIKIYENRFIMSLIHRLQLFIELRYKYIKDHGDTKNSDVVTIKKEVNLGDGVYTFEGELKMVAPSDDEGHRETNQDLLDRLTSLRKRTLYLVRSPFMKEMSRALPVYEPVQQTNILRHNHFYQDAYKLWTFINRYEELGITYRVTQTRVDFDKNYYEKINQLVFNSLLCLDTENAAAAPEKIRQYQLKPKLLAGSLDIDLSDERFLEHSLPVEIRLTRETSEQREARLKKAAAKAKAEIEKQAQKEAAKKEAAIRRKQARERAKQKAEELKEKQRLKKIAAEERQRKLEGERKKRREEKQRIIEERKRYEQMLKDEARKLKEARLRVKEVAETELKETLSE